MHTGTLVKRDTSRSPPADVDVCISGGGPAGALLALLLVRAGLKVTVLEKHADFLRDFRGDTIHPSTLEILDELGLADRFLELPHSRVPALNAYTPTGTAFSISFDNLGGRFPFIAFVPQWDFLNFITAEAAKYPGFHLEMNAEVHDLVWEAGQVCGVRYRTPSGPRELRAAVTIGADGRESRTRALAGLRVIPTSPAMDVLWFRLSRSEGDPESAALQISTGHLLVLINRRTYWQVAYAIQKGDDARVRAKGIEAFRQSLVELAPELANRVHELTSWDSVKLLTVRSDRVLRWYAPGYLAIGDAAHAMSPVGGVGINVAIHDAVAAANALWRPLKKGTISTKDLRRVQSTREFPVRFTQWWQGLLQKSLFPANPPSARAALTPKKAETSSSSIEWIGRIPVLGRMLARMVAFGIFRPHVRSPASF
jgi:2-polyprenyl-6-methoxyphenol hydroxylase-like FAD-dependent oxidoreductase